MIIPKGMLSMTIGRDPKDPPKKWKMEILQIEIDSNLEFLERCGSPDDEGYIFTKETQADLECWLDDLKNNSSAALSREDLDWRENIIENQIAFHHDVLTEDHSISEVDRSSIRKDIEYLEEWKRYLKKWKKAFC
jgi:hypothetical protein